MKIPVKQCCCFIPLRVGGILIGTIGVLQTLIENLEIIPYLLESRNNFDNGEKGEKDEMYLAENIRKPTMFMMGCLAIFSEISGVSSILLIIGAYIENHKLIRPYLLIQGLCNIFFGFLGIYGKDLTIFIGFSLNLYWYLCVLSMYQKLIEDKRTLKNIATIPEMYYIV